MNSASVLIKTVGTDNNTDVAEHQQVFLIAKNFSSKLKCKSLAGLKLQLIVAERRGHTVAQTI